MAQASGDREQFFPAIEKKYGLPVSAWLERLAELGDAKYLEQIAFLRENHGFSQAHANALVMYARNSPSSRRFKNADEFFASLDPATARTARAIFAAVAASFPALELVIAWNQPMLRSNGKYVIGLSVAKHHILLNPFSTEVLDNLAGELSGYEVKKRTIQVPLDWTVDQELLRTITAARLAELTKPSEKAVAPRTGNRS